ncbi:MAG: chemotaxis protein CheD [Desulfovibrionaceae bacterium]
MKRILDNYPDAQTHYLGIAEGGVYIVPTAVTTVLGSCVSATFFCPHTHIGGTFHALLPRERDFKEKGTIVPYRYVDTAIAAVLDEMEDIGVRMGSLQCKVFGGGSGLINGEVGTGRRNVQTAFDVLEARRIRVLASSVGGVFGRKLLFISSTGDVYIKRLNATACHPRP